VDAQQPVSRIRSKTMTNDIAKADEMKAVERWENEGGKVSTFRSVWTSLKSFRTKEERVTSRDNTRLIKS